MENKIKNALNNNNKSYFDKNEDAKNLLLGMLQTNIAQRISVDEAIKCSWFDDVRQT